MGLIYVGTYLVELDRTIYITQIQEAIRILQINDTCDLKYFEISLPLNIQYNIP